MDSIEDINTMSKFFFNLAIVVLVLVSCCLMSLALKQHEELMRRIMRATGGDSKMRYNMPDMLGASVLPSKVVRLERAILHDIEGSALEALDVYIEIDFGTNMLATTRVRHVQPVGSLLTPVDTASAGLEGHDQPRTNRCVFTDKLEFNVRPLGEQPMKIAVKDQDIVGSEVLGLVQIPPGEVVAAATKNVDRELNFDACVKYQLALDGRALQSRLLLWFTLVT